MNSLLTPSPLSAYNRINIAAVAVACAMGLLVCGTGRAEAAAIFDWPGVPAHAGHYSWTAPQNAGGADQHFHHHHFHNRVHDPVAPAQGEHDAREGHDVFHQLSGNTDYDAYSLWVNREYKFIDKANSIDDLGGGSTAPDSAFSHGFIEEHRDRMPRFRFVGDPFELFDISGAAFDARPIIRMAFQAWTDIAIDDPHLVMGLAFREHEAGVDLLSEIRVEVRNHIPDKFAQWIPEARRLQFGLFNDAALTSRIRWFTGADRTKIPADMQSADLMTVALHEVGHIVGLDHQPDLDDIMYVFAGTGVTIAIDGAFRTLSDDDRLGARDLYSYCPAPDIEERSGARQAADAPACASCIGSQCTVPEPVTLVLLSVGIIGYAWHRRRPSLRTVEEAFDTCRRCRAGRSLTLTTRRSKPRAFASSCSLTPICCTSDATRLTSRLTRCRRCRPRSRSMPPICQGWPHHLVQ